MKSRNDVLALMEDDVPRTVREICHILRGGYSSYMSTAVTLLVKEHKLVKAGMTATECSTVKAPMFKLFRAEIERNGTNPFEWQTYKQYEAEVPQLHGH